MDVKTCLGNASCKSTPSRLWETCEGAEWLEIAFIKVIFTSITHLMGIGVATN